jgi:hypothetical protein
MRAILGRTNSDHAASHADYLHGVKINGSAYHELCRHFDFHGQRV